MSKKVDLKALSDIDWDKKEDDDFSSQDISASPMSNPGDIFRDDIVVASQNSKGDQSAAAPIPADDQDGAAPKSAEATSPTDTDATGGADAQETGDDLETQVDATPQPSEPSPIPGFLDLTKPDDEVETGGDGSQHYGNGKRPPPYSFA